MAIFLNLVKNLVKSNKNRYTCINNVDVLGTGLQANLPPNGGLSYTVRASAVRYCDWRCLKMLDMVACCVPS